MPGTSGGGRELEFLLAIGLREILLLTYNSRYRKESGISETMPGAAGGGRELEFQLVDSFWDI